MIKTAVYFRVPADKEKQTEVFEKKVSYFENLIGENPEWQLCHIYFDRCPESTSFNKMLEDAKNGEFEQILTLDVKTFSKDAETAYKTAEELSKIGVGITFINDCIDTLDFEGMFRLGLMASVKEEKKIV